MLDPSKNFNDKLFRPGVSRAAAMRQAGTPGFKYFLQGLSILPFLCA
jgi:hypothetical protein